MNYRQNPQKTSRYVNWITVWGALFLCIAYNLYIDNHQRRQVESQRTDSLDKETIRLQRRLQEAEAEPAEKPSMIQPTDSQKLASVSELYPQSEQAHPFALP